MAQTFAAPRSLAVAALLGAFAAAGPLAAAAADPVPSPMQQLAQTNAPPPAATSKSAKPKRSVVDRVEAQIKRLHDELKITPEQETQWAAVADAMRDNGKTMQAVIAERRQNRATMTAVDDLRSYQKVAETHVEGLQKLIPAFDTLYASMSPEQKKNADQVFGHRRNRTQKGKQPQ